MYSKVDDVGMLHHFLGIDKVEVVSLTHNLALGSVCHYPGDPEYRIESITTMHNDDYELHYVSIGEHTGTHWGAPRHFNAGGATADELDPEDFFLPGVMIDVQKQSENDADYAVSVHDLEVWESAYGPFPDECAVILNTGWYKRWPTERFANLDRNGVPRHPGFSPEAVQWLCERGTLGHRGALGTDAFSPDVGVDTTFAVSKILYQEHRLSLEVLANLDRLSPHGFWLTLGGFINTGGTGSPATVYALIPKV